MPQCSKHQLKENCTPKSLGRASASPTVTCWLGLSPFAIYIYIYKSSVRPLWLCARDDPTKIPRKSRTSTLPSPGFDWRWSPLERMPVQEPCSLFLPPLHRVFSCPLRQARSGFFWLAFCPSLPVFHTQEIDDWRPNFSFRFQWPLIDWVLSAVFGKDARTHWENNQYEESNPQRRNERV